MGHILHLGAFSTSAVRFLSQGAGSHTVGTHYNGPLRSGALTSHATPRPFTHATVRNKLPPFGAYLSYNWPGFKGDTQARQPIWFSSTAASVV